MKPENYAYALLCLIEKGDKPVEAVKKLHATLEKDGRTSLIPLIGRACERLAAKTQAREKQTLIIARKHDEAKARKESGAKDADIAIDESLIGGWRLEEEETLQDASWKTSLLTIYQNTTSA